jgi:hypothetical protein
MNKRWSACWKCESDIMSREECFFLKSRDGDFNYCRVCYDAFLAASKDFIRPERSKREELKISLHTAISNFHDNMVKREAPLRMGPSRGKPILVHKDAYWRDCEVCREILSMRCSEHCGNTVREAQ